MLLTVLIVLAVYLVSCYTYGAYLLARRAWGRRAEAGTARQQLRGVVTHRYPAAAPPRKAAA